MHKMRYRRLEGLISILFIAGEKIHLVIHSVRFLM